MFKCQFWVICFQSKVQLANESDIPGGIVFIPQRDNSSPGFSRRRRNYSRRYGRLDEGKQRLLHADSGDAPRVAAPQQPNVYANPIGSMPLPASALLLLSMSLT